MIQRKHPILLALLISVCSCSGKVEGLPDDFDGDDVGIDSTMPGVIQGGDAAVAWTLTGTGFLTGAAVTTNVTGVTVGNIVVVSSTEITFDLTADNTIVAGTGKVRVTNPDTTTGPYTVPTVPEFVTLSGSVQPIFTLNCAVAGCHTGGAPPAGLDLFDGNSHAATVGVPSTQVPALSRIFAGDPGSSYLVDKIEGTQNVGVRMPSGAPALSATDKQLIRKWIEAGALDD